MRQLDQASIDAIKSREGCRLAAYQDSGGTWTIGYGKTGSVKEGDTCTQEQADKWLADDMAWAGQCVEGAVKVHLSDSQFGALVSFAYNVGAQAFTSSTLVNRLNAGDYAAVPQELERWNKVNGKVSNGLTNRRNSEIGQWVKGSFVSSSVVTPDVPKPWWQTGHIGKLVAAGVALGGNMSMAGINHALDQARDAITIWQGFAFIAGGLSFGLILWTIFGHKKDA